MDAYDRTPTDLHAIGGILQQAFGFDVRGWDTYIDTVGVGAIRGLIRDDRPIAGCAILDAGQFWGGRSVPVGAVAAVGVPPELRGQRIGSTLMRGVLDELRDRGVPLCALYASTQAFYHRLGFERAGVNALHELELGKIRLYERALEATPISPAVPDELRALQREVAAREAGALDRNAAFWTRATAADGPRYGWRLGPAEAPEGYLVTAQEGQVLRVLDRAFRTPAAARRAWTILADHATTIERTQWRGPCAEPWLQQLPDRHHTLQSRTVWYLRIVDVDAALALRGYPGAAAAELHLEVDDAAVPGNSGRRVLRVREGTGAVEPGGRGELQCGPRGLVALYSGMYTAHQLAAQGLLAGAPGALDAAAQVFAGPEPWTVERW